MRKVNTANITANIIVAFLLILSFNTHTLAFAEDISGRSKSAMQYLVPVGRTIGVTLDMEGAQVVDTESIVDYNGDKHDPAREAGISASDIIIQVDGEEVENVTELTERLNAVGDRETEIVVRTSDGKEKCVSIRPVLSSDDGNYKLGVWVNDAASGIGTMTYYDPKTREFGGLGHGICDTDTGEIITAKSGDIFRSVVAGVRKGEKGFPGELVGVFSDANEKIGTVFVNNSIGIKGELKEGADINLSGEAIPVAEFDEVSTGAASILANIENDVVDEFEIEIEKVNYDNDEYKDIIFKVSDDRLLDKTGGIVQGMSGSPIIQNGKLIGAVTHVLINDPSKGYGVFIKKMLE